MFVSRSSLALSLIILSGICTSHAQSLSPNQAKPPNPIDIAKYVPMDNGRTWTYEWTVRLRNGRKETLSRTKSFEGPEFLSTGHAYKFMSDLGDYVLLSVENGQLLMHGSVEPHRDIRFVFDPPVILYAPDMKLGRAYTAVQPTEDGTSQRKWSTIVDGFVDVDTPMGKFSRSLRIRLEMDSAAARTKAVYYYSKGIGLVAYQYEAWSGNEDKSDIAIEASLKLAQVGGRSVTNASQLETFTNQVAATSRLDDPEARKEFKQSYERLYLWPAKFPGFKSTFTLKYGSGTPAVQATAIVTPDLKIKVEGVEKQAAQLVETELSHFVTHLKDKPFEDEFKDAVIVYGARDPDQGTKIQVSSEQRMGTSYLLKNGEIFQIGHSYGRVRFVVNHTRYMKTDENRLIPTSYTIIYYSNETNELIDEITYNDEFIKVDDLWLPRKRVKVETTKGHSSTLEVEFINYQLMK